MLMHRNTFRIQGEKASTPYSVPFLYILHFSYLTSYWRHPKGRPSKRKTLSCCTVPQTNSIFPPSHQYWIRLVDYSKCSALETSQESTSVFATLQKKGDKLRTNTHPGSLGFCRTRKACLKWTLEQQNSECTQRRRESPKQVEKTTSFLIFIN